MTSATKHLSIVVLLASAMQGCIWVDDASDLKLFVREKLAAPGGGVEPLPELVVYEAFVYEGPWQRDPFVPLLPQQFLDNDDVVVAPTIMPDFDRIKEYLEEFPVEQLQMVGTITSPIDGQLIALVRDSSSEVHQIKMGDRMGIDYGVVVKIDERGIELKEIVANGRGGWMSRPRVVKLPGLE
jgi:type IV pilus assembly protein PilP